MPLFRRQLTPWRDDPLSRDEFFQSAERIYRQHPNFSQTSQHGPAAALVCGVP
jgi:hypothetical protein